MRQKFLLDLLIRNKQMVLLTGPSGCGKTNLIKNYLKENISKNDHDISYFHFSAHTTAHQTQESILSRMTRFFLIILIDIRFIWFFY